MHAEKGFVFLNQAKVPSPFTIFLQESVCYLFRAVIEILWNRNDWPWSICFQWGHKVKTKHYPDQNDPITKTLKLIISSNQVITIRSKTKVGFEYARMITKHLYPPTQELQTTTKKIEAICTLVQKTFRYFRILVYDKTYDAYNPVLITMSENA